ncbi:unnamed protein product [Allacma fusca]|uniref:Uncharacterized protein n=1 Tax=Allacma fusca TaxID=39272 RepID=A0A8J2K348_9HEXA|nr:unnamed protein product [Allacma fusca]
MTRRKVVIFLLLCIIAGAESKFSCRISFDNVYAHEEKHSIQLLDQTIKEIPVCTINYHPLSSLFSYIDIDCPEGTVVSIHPQLISDVDFRLYCMEKYPVDLMLEHEMDKSGVTTKLQFCCPRPDLISCMVNFVVLWVLLGLGRDSG